MIKSDNKIDKTKDISPSVLRITISAMQPLNDKTKPLILNDCTITETADLLRDRPIDNKNLLLFDFCLLPLLTLTIFKRIIKLNKHPLIPNRGDIFLLKNKFLIFLSIQNPCRGITLLLVFMFQKVF